MSCSQCVRCAICGGLDNDEHMSLPHIFEEAEDGARKALRGLQRGPNCWCEMAIGNPMYRDHSPQCKAARSVFDVG